MLDFNKILKKSGLMILVVAVLIAAIGIISIYSSTYQKEGKLWQDIYKRQILWLILGVALFIFISKLRYRTLWDGAYILYGIIIVLLFFVFLLGVTRLGAQRWLRIGGFNFQPSEFAKIAIILFLARYFSNKSIGDLYQPAIRFRLFRGFILPLMLVGVSVGLIIEQPDLGSALMVLFVFLGIVYISGVRLVYLVSFLSVGILSMPVLWHFLRDYQKERLMVFLNPNIDPLGAGYTIIQSKIAIGSGGLFGKGWLLGTQSQLRFLPESHTDFIFATFAEEWGFLGATVLLALYFVIIRYGFGVASRTSDSFGRILALGITFLLSIQIFINISMTLGLAPVVGIPLPFMSYGGSSMFINFIALGILVSIDNTRSAF